jgi:cyclopropane fatty-acyl-phospholipid synthase-like methyltransferase
MKPYSASCDENREAILAVIQPLLCNCRTVLEIGSGTGQHAVYFAERLPHLVWQTSDCADYHAGIEMWLQDANLANTPAPLELDVSISAWPQLEFDAVFSANTAHIMHWHDVEAMFAGTGSVLTSGGRFLLYGPFNYDNRYTSDSNARFDQWLKTRDPASGIKNFEDLERLAKKAGMTLKNDYQMPANNRILYWEKQEAG